MIIDFHLSLQTPPVRRTPYERFLADHGVADGYATAGEAVAALDRDGIDLGVLLHGPLEDRLAAVAAHPGRLLAFAPVSLRALQRDPAATIAAAAKALDHGCAGLGSITPYREAIDLDDASVDVLCALAAERGVPVHFECSIPSVTPAPGRVSTPIYDFEALARRHPQASFILGSWGGLLCLHEMMPELPRALNNIHYDTATPVDDADVDALLATVPKIVRQTRVLYGSASPRKPRDLSPYRSAAVPREVGEGILGRNARFLLRKHLPVKPASSQPS